MIEIAIPNLAMEKKLVIKQEEDRVCCYLARTYYEELACARMLRDLNNACKLEDTDEKEKKRILSRIEQVEKELSIELDELQHRAVL